MSIYIVYKTTNLVNGRYYIGKHKTDDIDNDSYLGSGVVLQQAIKKYGKESFEREVIKICQTEKEAYEYEKLAICEEVLADPKCYNLKGGGVGGKSPTPALLERMSQVKRGENNPMYRLYGKDNPNYGKKRPGVGGRPKGKSWSDEERAKHEYLRKYVIDYSFTQDPERNRKISEAKRGKPGAALGKTWYTDGVTETYATECPAGFTKGRKPGRISNKKGMRWYNNGTDNRQFRDGEVPDGFRLGRISKKQ